MAIDLFYLYSMRGYIRPFLVILLGLVHVFESAGGPRPSDRWHFQRNFVASESLLTRLHIRPRSSHNHSFILTLKNVSKLIYCRRMLGSLIMKWTGFDEVFAGLFNIYLHFTLQFISTLCMNTRPECNLFISTTS